MRDFEIIYQNIECSDNNLVPFDGCFSQQFSCVEGCKDCVNGICLDCLEGFHYQESTKQCIPICGDKKIQLNEECDDGNQIPYDGCYNCKFSCSIQCDLCVFGFIQHQILNDEDKQYQNFQQIKCQENDYTKLGFDYQSCQIVNIPYCSKNFLNSCSECNEGYKIDFNKKVCNPICNNGFLQQSEICDDFNNIQFDGCYNCQNSCQIQCLVCENQKCLKCYEGWQLIAGVCYQICGDGIVALGSIEQCDDGNQNPYDECFECQIQCSNNCLSCPNQDVCLRCQIGYILNENFCQPLCGDKIVIDDTEECDDGNDIEFDGCNQCKFSCPIVCAECVKGNCIKFCEDGYYYQDDQVCKSECGDQIITSDEECDDNNIIQFDGCFNCLYSCPNNYINCLKGQCYECNNDYKLINNQCYEICGDGIREFNEECDDNNYLNGDGCSSDCMIEQNWFCTTFLESTSECAQQPELKLTYLNKSQEIQYIRIQFTLNLQILTSKQSFNSTIQYQILDLDKTKYQIELIAINELQTNNFKKGIYEFKITFLETYLQKSFFEVLLNPEFKFTSEYGIIFFNHKIIKKVELKPIFILSEKQKSQALQFQSIGTSMIIGLGANILFFLLSGNFDDSFGIFDFLQYQSFFRYINVEFPQNLQIYFHSSDIITVNPLLQKLSINNVLDLAVGQEYLESIGQFKKNQINADLLTNIYGQIVLIGLAIIVVIFLQFYKKLYYKNFFTIKQFYYLKRLKSWILKYLAIFFYKLNQQIFKLERIFSPEGFKQFFLMNFWDLIFKVQLFLISNENKGFRLSHIQQCYYDYSLQKQKSPFTFNQKNKKPT